MGIVPAEIEQLIRGKPLIAHLATSVNGQPHVAPVWYHYEEDTIVVTTAGQKVENARHNPAVAVSIQRDENGHPEWMVLLTGTATVTADTAGIIEGTRSVYEHYLGEDTTQWDEFWQKQITDPDDERFVITVAIHDVASMIY